MSQFDRSLLAIYSGEQAEHLASIRQSLENALSAEPALQAAAIEELRRRLHTLKGAARAVGLEQTEMLTHQAEDVLSRLRSGTAESPEENVRALQRTADAIEDILAAAIADRTPPDSTNLLRLLVRLSQPDQSSSAASTEPAPVPTPPEEPDQPAPEPEAALAPPNPDHLRVQARSLDELIRNTSDLLIESNVGTAKQLEDYVTRLQETAAEWTRLRRSSAGAVREMGRHPELAPALECLTYMDGRLAMLGREVGRVSEELGRARRAAQDKSGAVYQAACRLRMTSAESIFAAFGPMVRDLARSEGREVVFESAGLELHADLLVLQGLKDPLMHLLRNAVSHGIERPEERQSKGKPREGKIRLTITPRGDRLQVVVEDDGRGIDYQAVEREARARGLLGEDEILDQEEDARRLILRAGFSTSDAVTDVSGRGMGLAIVESAIRRLHGTIDLGPRTGGGTRVVITAPLSISTEHVLLVSVGGHTFGIATAHVEHVLRIPANKVRNVNGRESISTETGPVVLHHLAAVLGLPSSRETEEATLPCAILTNHQRRMAFVVDRLDDDREATIKDTGLQENAGATAGAIPMEDGSVAVMLNVDALLEMAGRRRRAGAQASKARKQVRKYRILVVDDSLTTRSLEKNILEANGFEVKLAVDGLEAFEMLRIEQPDLVISDVSMPRMTGFQLLEQMKKSANLKKIPFILVTSLESREEQQLGLSLGADAYIVKRKFDQRQLLDVIREIL